MKFSRMVVDHSQKYRTVSTVVDVARTLLYVFIGLLGRQPPTQRPFDEERNMRYIAAWLLGVPLSVIALWYIVGHSACG
jgi:hypothetical protein